MTLDHLSEASITKTALKKSRGKRRKAIIPLTDALEELLSELRTRKRKDGVNTVNAKQCICFDSTVERTRQLRARLTWHQVDLSA